MPVPMWLATRGLTSKADRSSASCTTSASAPPAAVAPVSWIGFSAMSMSHVCGAERLDALSESSVPREKGNVPGK